MILSEAEKGYVAGILDGEGWIGTSHRVVEGIFLLHLRIANKDISLMKWLEEKLSAIGIEGKIYTNKIGVSYYVLNGAISKELLRIVEPYVIVKKKHVETALQFPMVGSAGTLTKEDKLLQALCHVRLKKLNVRISRI